MKNESLISLIASMHRKLNDLIEMYDYNLQSSEVIDYSQKLDRVLDDYIKSTFKSRKEIGNLSFVQVNSVDASSFARRRTN